MKKVSSKIPVDNPVQSIEEDQLDRIKIAESFAEYVLNHDVNEGLVVGLFGPWGSGKTSFLNFAQETFKKKGIKVISFQPWMYSGRDYLIDRFFLDISEGIGSPNEAGFSLKNIGDTILVYGRHIESIARLASIATDVIPIDGEGFLSDADEVISAWDTIKKFLYGIPSRVRKLFSGANGDEHYIHNAEKLKEAIDESLRELESPIIVTLDDIDRLEDSEIKDIFRLARKVANFPNVIYIVVCDRFRVEQAFNCENISGRDYLEKIIQIYFDLPQIPQHMLKARVLKTIFIAAPAIEDLSESDNERWTRVFDEIVFPLIRNMRDLYRYRSAVSGTIIHLLDRVDVIDVLALEAIRLFMPDIYNIIVNNIDYFTVSYSPDQYGMTTSMLDDDIRRKAPVALLEIRAEKLREGLDQKADQDLYLLDNEDYKQHYRREEYRRGKFNRIIEAMVGNLFPAHSIPSSQYESYFSKAAWGVEQFRECRIVHDSILRYYLTRTENDDLRYADIAENLLQQIHDEEGAAEYLSKFDTKELSEVILRLRYFENNFGRRVGGSGGPSIVKPSLVVLWNLLSGITDYSVVVEAHILDHIKIITHMIINTVPEDIMVGGYFLVDALKDIKSLSARIELVELVKNYEHPTNKKITEYIMDEIEGKLYIEILNDNDGSMMAEEWGVSEIILFAKRIAGYYREEIFYIPQSPKLAYAIYKRAEFSGQDTRQYFHLIFDEDNSPYNSSSTEVSREMMRLSYNFHKNL